MWHGFCHSRTVTFCDDVKLQTIYILRAPEDSPIYMLCHFNMGFLMGVLKHDRPSMYPKTWPILHDASSPEVYNMYTYIYTSVPLMFPNAPNVSKNFGLKHYVPYVYKAFRLISFYRTFRCSITWRWICSKPANIRLVSVRPNLRSVSILIFRAIRLVTGYDAVFLIWPRK